MPKALDQAGSSPPPWGISICSVGKRVNTPPNIMRATATVDCSG